MHKKIKSTIGVALCAMVFVGGTSSIAMANEDSIGSQDIAESEERYTYIRTAQSTLSISGGNATVIAIADASPVVTKCFITSRLQQKVNGTWTTIDSWTVWGTNSFNDLRRTKVVQKGYEYRVFSTMKAYVGEDYESIASYSNIVRY